MKGLALASLCGAVLSILSCIGPGTAFAAEGPYYKLGGARLSSGTSEVVEVKATVKNYVLKAAISGIPITVTCTGSKFVAGATINGSTGGNAGTSKERFEFTGCTQMGNGAGCLVRGGKFTTAPLKNSLGYSEMERKGKIQFLYKPESGTEIANVPFEGASCSLASSVLKGSMVAEALSKAATIDVGSEPAAAEALEIHFPSTLIGKIWIESGGSLTNESTSLEWGGNTVTTFEGQSEIWLMLRENWGLFTK